MTDLWYEPIRTVPSCVRCFMEYKDFGSTEVQSRRYEIDSKCLACGTVTTCEKAVDGNPKRIDIVDGCHECHTLYRVVIEIEGELAR